MINTVHASCVAMGKFGLLIRGPSGAGKSDLVLRLMDQAKAKLVADDQILLEKIGDKIIASPPAILAGLLEIRGQGIVKCQHQTNTEIHMIIDLVPLSEIERMPNDEDLQAELLECVFPRLKLWSQSPSAVARINYFIKERLANSFSLGVKKR